MEPIVKIRDLHFEYTNYEEQEIAALDGVNLDIQQGEFVVIIGHNGSGKSTLAKHINAILKPSRGEIWVKGLNVQDESNMWEVRQSAGMVFQNPDNQLVATVVEEDVAFGPENLGIPPKEIRERVDEALLAVGMEKYSKTSPHFLSGGQKQRVAIAGVLAMKPEIIILDEPTAMLDPAGRREVLDTVKELNEKEGITVIHITHYMEEAVDADRVVVMDHGKILMQGTPREIFSQVDRLKEIGLDVPQVTELAYELNKEGLKVPCNILKIEELADILCQYK
ncbi:energy-coupling factor transporter ATPase [Xylanivirga thermophila]|uniref:energy-coupling factor transporter ATPase n=2 Tax=Xylanivirga thermophila TaxID=2496273 RepID=UPI00101C8CA6|nr:energy-coupling factor transporter ATPase [Xylanivirga thermophila]